jgi:hypothetical protein
VEDILNGFDSNVDDRWMAAESAMNGVSVSPIDRRTTDENAMNGVDSNTEDGWCRVDSAMNGVASKADDP